MTSLCMLEAQKLREIEWTEAGNDRFRAHLARQDGADNPAGRTLMATAMANARAALVAHLEAVKASAHPARDRIVPMVDLLGSDHVAVLSTRVAFSCALGPQTPRGHYIRGQIVAQGAILGEALEHDVRFRSWAATGSKYAVERFREGIAEAPRARRKRLEHLRELAAEAWPIADSAATGADVLSLAVEASPDIFVTPVVQVGGRTLKMLRLTDAAQATLSHLEDLMAVRSPKWGLMIVPPRPWTYAETTDG